MSNQWEMTEAEIVAKMRPGEWKHFSEWDNIAALVSLVKKGILEPDRSGGNVVSGMGTSLKLRLVAKGGGESE